MLPPPHDWWVGYNLLLQNRSGLNFYQLTTATHPTVHYWHMTYQPTWPYIATWPYQLHIPMMGPSTALHGHHPTTWVVTQPSATLLIPSQATSGLLIMISQATCSAWLPGLVGPSHRNPTVLTTDAPDCHHHAVLDPYIVYPYPHHWPKRRTYLDHHKHTLL